MKRLLVLFITVMIGLLCFSQSVIIRFKDGSFENHKMSVIESVEFVDEDNETSASILIRFKDGSFENHKMSMTESVLFVDDNVDDNDDETSTSASIHLEKAGTLSSKLSKSQASELLKLKLSGHMDARDFDFIKWDCMKVEEVDLSDVVIDSYTGVEGTEEGVYVTYAANEIPSGAFFYWKDLHKYNYEGMPIEKGMVSLKKVVLPQGIKAIQKNAFARASNLTEINIPEGVKSIDIVAFNLCKSIEELRLPSTLFKVGHKTFGTMDKLKRVYISAITPPSANANSFDLKPSDAVLYVPKGTENQYRNAVGWNTFTSIVGMGDTPDGNSRDKVGWQIISDDFDKSIPFTKIRVLNKKASIGSYCCVAFSTVPNKNVDTDKYYVSFGSLTIGDNMIHDLIRGFDISSCTNLGNNWYEYKFSRPVYFAYFQENCPRGQIMAYINNNGEDDDDDDIGNSSSNNYDAVDLGLSVLWARYNVGASSPEQFGDKFAWGETETKASYTKESYMWIDSETFTFKNLGDIGGTEFDAAHVKWGGKWRMPTPDEFEELRIKCTWQWTALNSVGGFIVTGPNGNSIFIAVNKSVCFWTSTEYSSGQGNNSDAYCFTLTPGTNLSGKTKSWTDKTHGHYIRPVMSK